MAGSAYTYAYATLGELLRVDRRVRTWYFEYGVGRGNGGAGGRRGICQQFAPLFGLGKYFPAAWRSGAV